MISASSSIPVDDQIYLFGLVTDYSRKFVRDKFDFSIENLLNALQNFDFEVLSIIDVFSVVKIKIVKFW